MCQRQDKQEEMQEIPTKNNHKRGMDVYLGG